VIPADPGSGIPGTSDLRAFLSATLPGHMIPAVFTALHTVPLTPSGKIDRGALPAPAPAARPEVSFRYLDDAHRAAAGGSSARMRPLAGSLGKPRSDAGKRPHLIEIRSEVANGCLAVAWAYSGQVHDEMTVTRLARRHADVLGQLIDHCSR
jgi:hypothetical protein